MAFLLDMVLMLMLSIVLYLGMVPLVTTGGPLMWPAVPETPSCGPHGCLSPSLGAAAASNLPRDLRIMMVYMIWCYIIPMIGRIATGEEIQRVKQQ